MKTLKKILSLVLVVAMLASMMIVGAAAAEDEVTNYEEAVAVVTGVGIIEGDENGMNYQGLVTREQAAKIIAYLLLGEKTAEALKTTAAPFADVAATRWSAGYIAYLKGQGIISGVSDTEFDPTANVTGIAFAKMLLTAVGYGANGEFEGKDWDINTITFANQAGIYKGTLAEDVAAAATREEAMLYAFNLLTKVPVVKYNKTFESYYVGNSALDTVDGTFSTSAPEATNNPYAFTLGWTKYELKTIAGGSTDDFGRPGTSWASANVPVAEAVANTLPDATFVGSINSGNLYTTFGKSIVENLSSNMSGPNNAVGASGPYVYYTNANIVVYEDGVLQTNYEFTKDEILKGEATNTIGGTGAVVELYLSEPDANGDYTLTAVVWYEHFGEVTRVNTVAGTTTVTIKDIQGGTVNVTSDELDVSALVKKDQVVYTRGRTAVASVREAAAPVIATYNAFNAVFKWYTMNGAIYSATKMGDATAINTFDNTYELYLDSYGNILYAKLYEEGEGANQYLYVQLAEAQAYAPGAIDGKEAKVALTVLYPNGGKEVVYSNVKSTKISGNTVYYITVGTNDYAITGANQLTPIVNNALTSPVGVATVAAGWMRYTTNDAGEVTLKALSSDYAKVETVTVEPAKATTGGSKTADSKTVLTLIDGDGNAVVYTGIANFVDKTGSALVTYGYEGKVAKTITMVVPSINTALNLAYCVADLGQSGAGYTYQFMVDGATQYITLDTASCYAGYIYNLTSNDGDYTATLLGYYGNVNPNVPDDDADATTGVVNAGYGMDFTGAGVPGSDLQNYGVMNRINSTWAYYEWAVVDTVDETYFTTTAVKNTAEDIADSAAGKAVNAYTYYYDGNTVIYDATGMGATEISEGDVFIAYVDESASATYNGEAYVSYIWIVA